MVSTLVKTSFHRVIAHILQSVCLFSVLLSFLGSSSEIGFHGLELRIIFWDDWIFLFLRNLIFRVRLKDVPFGVVRARFLVMKLLGFLPEVPFSSACHFLCLINLVFFEAVSQLRHSNLKQKSEQNLNNQLRIRDFSRNFQKDRDLNTSAFTQTL